MAAGKWKLYDTAKEKIGQGIIDLDTHVFKCALFLNTSNANTLTFDELADLTNQVSNGNGYTTGGQTLSSVTWTNSSGKITFDCGNPLWNITGAGINPQYAVIYDDTVAGDPLLCICVLNAGSIAPGMDFSIVMSSAGVFYLDGANVD